MRVTHLYPFPCRGVDGGTLRLQTALGAFEGDEQDVWEFEPAARGWASIDITAGLAPRTAPPPHVAPGGAVWKLKRLLFPSTLWESGLRAMRAFRNSEALRAATAADLVVLHTTYLANLTRVLAPQTACVVDAYDLVWRAHALDGATYLTAWRRAYAETVRWRELRAVRPANALIVAGWADFLALERHHPRVAWVPTGIHTINAKRTAAPDTLSIGILGNFRHWPTRQAAQELLRAPIAQSERVEIHLAGLGSDQFHPRERLRLHGEIKSLESFYSRVDCVVVPVRSGAGMKVKLAEAILAGRAVITTPAGAAGFPPSMRANLAICDRLDAIDENLCRVAIDSFTKNPASGTAVELFRWESVIARYRVAATAGISQ